MTKLISIFFWLTKHQLDMSTVEKATELLYQAQELATRAKKHLAKTEKMVRQAKCDLARLEKEAQEPKFEKVEPFVCAIQHAPKHSYSKEPAQVQTTYLYDGQHVYVQGTTKPISKHVLVDNAHYGSMGRGGKYDHTSLIEVVKAHYLDYFLGKDTTLPKPLMFYVSYCGN